MKKFKGISLKKRKQYFYYFVLIFSSILLLSQYQNCVAGSGNGLNFGSNNNGSTGTLPESCSSGCGFVDYVYWNGCQANVMGWAWSDVSYPNKIVQMTGSSNITAGNNSCSNTTQDTDLGINQFLATLGINAGNSPLAFGRSNTTSCSFPSLTYKNNNFSITSATVQSTTGAKNFGAQNLQNISFVPAACTTPPQQFEYDGLCNGDQSSGKYSGVGWLDEAKFDGNCNLTIKGWGWGFDGANSSTTVLRIMLSNGSFYDVHPSETKSDVPALVPCVGNTSGFTLNLGVKKLPNSALNNGNITVTAYIIRPGFQPLNPLIASVGNCHQ